MDGRSPSHLHEEGEIEGVDIHSASTWKGRPTCASGHSQTTNWSTRTNIRQRLTKYKHIHRQCGCHHIPGFDVHRFHYPVIRAAQQKSRRSASRGKKGEASDDVAMIAWLLIERERRTQIDIQECVCLFVRLLQSEAFECLHHKMVVCTGHERLVIHEAY